jgi:hypothetical protein
MRVHSAGLSRRTACFSDGLGGYRGCKKGHIYVKHALLTFPLQHDSMCSITVENMQS